MAIARPSLPPSIGAAVVIASCDVACHAGLRTIGGRRTLDASAA